jgi:hypothetical protein
MQSIFKGVGKRFSKVIENLLYSERGRIILSIIFGLGLATLFRKICNSNDCYRFIGPEQNEIRDKIFSFDTSENAKCYILREENVKCGSKEKSVEFA